MRQCRQTGALTGPLERSNQWKMDMKIDTWNMRHLCRPGSLKAVVHKLAQCRLDLVGVQVVRWDKSGEPIENYTVFHGKGK